jgi:hypothetical protein
MPFRVAPEGPMPVAAPVVTIAFVNVRYSAVLLVPFGLVTTSR